MPLIRATGCAFNLNELFMNFPYDKLQINCKDCKKAIGDLHRDILVKRIFKECVKMVFDDVIDNNVTFQLPTGKKKCDIHMKRVQGDAFRNLKKSGKWANVSLIQSSFTGYELGLFMYGERDPRIKTIYVDKSRKDRITQLTNEGKQYC